MPSVTTNELTILGSSAVRYCSECRVMGSGRGEALTQVNFGALRVAAVRLPSGVDHVGPSSGHT